MKMLSEAGDAQLPALLSPLADAYAAWIDAQERRIDDPAARLAGHEAKAREHIAAGAGHARADPGRDRKRWRIPTSPRRSGSPTTRCGSSESTRSLARRADATARSSCTPPSRRPTSRATGRGGPSSSRSCC